MIDILCILDTLSGILRHGRLHRLSWRGVTGAPVERILRKYGVSCYGRRMVGKHERACLVPRRQAVWAEYLLLSGGVQLTGKLLGKGKPAGKMPKEWGVGIRRPSLVARIGKWMGV